MTRILSLTDFFPFGKHKGEQVEDVIEDDPKYIAWTVSEDVFDYDDEATEKLEAKKVI